MHLYASHTCPYSYIIYKTAPIIRSGRKIFVSPRQTFSRLSILYYIYCFLCRFVNRGVKKTSLSLRKKTFLPIVERTAYKSRFFMARPPRLVLFFILRIYSSSNFSSNTALPSPSAEAISVSGSPLLLIFTATLALPALMRRRLSRSEVWSVISEPLE